MMFRKNDILVKLMDLHKQATTERSHYYVASCVREAIEEIAKLRIRIHDLEVTPPAQGGE